MRKSLQKGLCRRISSNVTPGVPESRDRSVAPLPWPLIGISRHQTCGVVRRRQFAECRPGLCGPATRRHTDDGVVVSGVATLFRPLGDPAVVSDWGSRCFFHATPAVRPRVRAGFPHVSRSDPVNLHCRINAPHGIIRFRSAAAGQRAGWRRRQSRPPDSQLCSHGLIP